MPKIGPFVPLFLAVAAMNAVLETRFEARFARTRRWG